MLSSRHIFPFLLAALFTACQTTKLPTEFGVPAFVSVSASPEAGTANLTAMTDGGAGIVRCGFEWGQGGTLGRTEVSALSGGSSFSATLNGLLPDTEYRYCAFISNGINEIRSDTLAFRTLRRPGPDNPDEIISLPDNAFRQYLIRDLDLDGDGRISAGEAAQASSFEACSDNFPSAEGLEYFTDLGKLCLIGSHEDWPLKTHGQLNAIDLGANTELTYLDLSFNRFRTLDLSNNRKLQFLFIVGCPLSAIDLSLNPDLITLAVASCDIKGIDLRANTKLEEVHLDKNRLESILIGDKPALRYLDCHENNLSELDLSECPKLKALDCSGNPNLAKLVLKKGQLLDSLTKDPDTEIVYSE